jgi:crotonobetainyl-CoA:carnitine CoA-transferase CaiB-like acyl-CoA transferase
MYLAYAIMVALWERQSSGRGQMIETNQLQAQVAVQVIHLVRAGTRNLGVMTNSPGVWKRPAHTYRAADGKYLVFMPLATAWPALWDALELGPFPDDPRLSSMVWPPELVTEIGTKIAQSISRRSRDEWLEIMESKQLGFMFSPVLDRGELMQEQQLADNEMLFEQPHPTVGPITMMTPPFRFSRTKWRKPKPAPELGQHTAQVLRELGYSPKQIADLRTRRVVA